VAKPKCGPWLFNVYYNFFLKFYVPLKISSRTPEGTLSRTPEGILTTGLGRCIGWDGPVFRPLNFFNWSISSSRALTLRFTQPLSEMSTGIKARPERNVDSLTAICEPIVYKMKDG
jgi:hypothetical protein